MSKIFTLFSWYNIKVVTLLSLVLLVCLITAYYHVKWTTQSRIYSQPETVPATDVALVLGTGKYLNSGTINPYFRNRMEAAAQLYHAGKIKHLIVSGDNHSRDYDEPTDMMHYLMELGVPASAITRDYAGFRTLDSIIRAKYVFGQTKLLIISQQFHNERALFIYDHKGIDAIAFSAADYQFDRTANAREFIGRFVAFLDVTVLHTPPKFYGPKVPLKIY